MPGYYRSRGYQRVMFGSDASIDARLREAQLWEM